MVEVSRTKWQQWRGLLWPLGATVLSLIVLPVAIEQYPEFFRDNKWILPVSAILVLACWTIPLFVHHRAQTLYSRIVQIRYVGWLVLIMVIVCGAVAMWMVGVRLFHFHRSHLDVAISERHPNVPPPSTLPQPQPATPTPEPQARTKPQKPRLSPVEPLDVRGENLCQAILDFAREAQQEEPVNIYSPSMSPDVMASQVLNGKNIRARLSTEFDKRFGGPLASITKEFEAKGISLELHMAQPPPSAFEMQLGGKELCRMVYALRQKKGIVDPKVAERAETYRTASRPCMGNPVADDPFPTDRGDQVGIRAIDMANIIENKADACVHTMSAGGVDDDAVRRGFVADVAQCCLV
jgi:hypothetical protein